MNSQVAVLLFRLFHIVAGVFWVGSILFVARFLFPTAQALGPGAGPVMDYITRVRKMPQVLLGAGIITVLSGLGLYWHDSAGFQSEWMRSPTAMVFGTGAVLALIALVFGILVNKPAAERLGALAGEIKAGGGPPTPAQLTEMQALQAKLKGALRVVATLLFLTTVAMALARYVG